MKKMEKMEELSQEQTENINNLFSNINLNVTNVEVLRERQKLSIGKKTNTLDFDLNDETYEKLSLFAKDISVSVEELIVDIIIDTMIQLIGKQTNPELITVDTAYLSVNVEKMIDSQKDYLVLNSENLDSKVVFLSNPDSLKKYNSLFERNILELIEYLETLKNSEDSGNIHTTISVLNDLTKEGFDIKEKKETFKIVEDILNILKKKNNEQTEDSGNIHTTIETLQNLFKK